MADIVYVWGRGKESVGMARGLELPQFKVVGYKQSFKIETLSTGRRISVSGPQIYKLHFFLL